jgi:predicted PurR-regulated permease PerM
VTTRPLDESRALIRYAILMTALAGIVLWCAYIVRNALLIVYVSIVLAIGFSPIVRIIERQRLGVAKRLPRWLARLRSSSSWCFRRWCDRRPRSGKSCRRCSSGRSSS